MSGNFSTAKQLLGLNVSSIHTWCCCKENERTHAQTRLYTFLYHHYVILTTKLFLTSPPWAFPNLYPITCANACIIATGIVLCKRFSCESTQVIHARYFLSTQVVIPQCSQTYLLECGTHSLFFGPTMTCERGKKTHDQASRISPLLSQPGSKVKNNVFAYWNLKELHVAFQLHSKADCNQTPQHYCCSLMGACVIVVNTTVLCNRDSQMP